MTKGNPSICGYTRYEDAFVFHSFIRRLSLVCGLDIPSIIHLGCIFPPNLLFHVLIARCSRVAEASKSRVEILNKYGEKLVGVLHDAGSKKLVILCHGFRSSKVEFMRLLILFGVNLLASDVGEDALMKNIFPSYFWQHG